MKMKNKMWCSKKDLFIESSSRPDLIQMYLSSRKSWHELANHKGDVLATNDNFRRPPNDSLSKLSSIVRLARKTGKYENCNNMCNTDDPMHERCNIYVMHTREKERLPP